MASSGEVKRIARELAADLIWAARNQMDVEDLADNHPDIDSTETAQAVDDALREVVAKLRGRNHRVRSELGK